MSYILDALRKSDQQRKRGVPLLLAAQAATNAPRRPPRLLYGLLALVLLGAGVAIGWLRPWQQEQTLPEAHVVLKPAATAENAAAPAATAALPQSAPEARPQEPPLIRPAASPAAPAPPGEAATIATAKAPAQPRPAAQKSNNAVKQALAARADAVAAPAPRADTVAAPAPRADTVAAPAPRADTVAAPAPRATEGATVESRALPPQSAAAQPAVPVAPTGAPAQTALAITELPASIQKDLPALSVMVHAYSDDPAKRMVGINNRLLHEGDEVAPGLKLEQITLDGMILSYKGYSFRRGVR